jgi:hypothetical protein
LDAGCWSILDAGLERMAVVWNIPTAGNRATADFMISSPLMDGEYDRLVPDYEEYRSRRIESGGTAKPAGDELPPNSDPPVG